jgi:hypothetical protein
VDGLSEGLWEDYWISKTHSLAVSEPVCRGFLHLRSPGWKICGLDVWIPFIISPSLRHYYGLFEPLLNVLSPNTHLPPSQITHLQLLGGASFTSSDVMGIWSDFGLLPRLTSIPISPSMMAHSFSFVGVCWKRAHRFPFRTLMQYPHAAALAQDLRFGVTSCPQLGRWERIRGTHTGSDYWSRAEHFISRRRSGEIAPAAADMVRSSALQYEMHAEKQHIEGWGQMRPNRTGKSSAGLLASALSTRDSAIICVWMFHCMCNGSDYCVWYEFLRNRKH